MTLANQSALEFLLSRRSRTARTLVPPVPGRAALEPILTAALRSPDHGKLEPWRLIVLERAALVRLADLVDQIGAERGHDPDRILKQRAAFADAHLVVAVIACPVASAKIPEVEQTLSAGAVCAALLNAALAAGWGANWLTGWAAQDADFGARGLALAPEEWIAGLVHIGTETVTPPDRPRPDPAQKVTWMEA